jgi:hypothetical protein
MILMNISAHMLIRVNITFLAQVLWTPSNPLAQELYQVPSMPTFADTFVEPTPESLARVAASLKEGKIPGDRSRSPGRSDRRQKSTKGGGKGQKAEVGATKPGDEMYQSETDDPWEQSPQTTMKSILNLQQRVRAGEGALFNTHLLEFDSPICVMGLATAETYGAKAKASPHNHNQGPPHLQIGMMMLGEILKLTESNTSVQKYREPILAWHTEAKKSTSLEEIADTLRHWQVKRCYHKEGTDQKFRLTYLLFGISMVDQKPMYMQTILAYLLRATPKTEQKIGAAPMAKMERDNQATLRKLLGGR